MKEKVFVIGFHKTGTTSMEDALEVLGYRLCGGDKQLMNLRKEIEIKNHILKRLKNWDGVQDMPWPLFYKELFDLYPKAKFILTDRDPEEWIKSVVRYFAGIRFPLHRKIYKVPCAEGNETVYTDVYLKHNEAVQTFFLNNPNFIVMRQGQNFNYPTLCKFLQIENVPDGLFPHSRNNKKRTLPNYKIYRILRSFYWNFKKNY